MALSPVFRKISFDRLAGWRQDDVASAFAAFRRSAFESLNKPYRSGALGVAAQSFAEAFSEARRMPESGCEPGTDAAHRFFERFFVPHLVVSEGQDAGFVTGFYEPEVEASPVRTSRFRFPLLARPADLVDIDDAVRPPGFDPYFAFARAAREGIVEYYDRREIEQGALAGRGLEIAWLADRVDVFFIHVQGAARLIMPDGSVKRVTYAAKTGHRFTGPGHVLAQLGEIMPGEVTMQSIRRWFHDNPQRIDEILWRNRSYIFFREAPVKDDELGPVAAARVPLTPGRSVAVDRLLHTFGTPFHIVAPTLDAFGGKGFERLMIAQDTGSAIIGPARGDLFAGSGRPAGEIAGVVRHRADFVALLPRLLLTGQP